ncbi:MAG: FAD-dependent oxidoreductase [Alteromonadaceae bacterium]|nr:FAD-dependent oxidoreductase [Alteromonadaceae bacterium]
MPIKVVKTTKVAVIGSGIVGVCAAVELLKRGFEVTLIDKSGVAQACSKGNAGHFATEQVFPMANADLLTSLPKMLLERNGPLRIHPKQLLHSMPWFLRFCWNMHKSSYDKNKAALKSLNRLSIDAYETLLRETNLSHMLVKQGSLMVFENTPQRQIIELLQNYQREGVAADLLTGRQLHNYQVGLHKSVGAAINFLDVAHTTNPESLCLALFNHFLSLGGQFLETSVDKIDSNHSSVCLGSAEGRFVFDMAIVAAGVWSKPLLEPLGYKVPLEAERGYHLMLPNTDYLNCPIASFERKMIMTPMNKGLRIAGTVEFAGINRPADYSRAKMLGNHASALLEEVGQLTVEQAQLDNSNLWMGMRPSFPDSLPVIGQAPKHPRLYLAFGHSHLGLTQAATSARLLAQLIQQESTAIDMRPFCLSRFN